MRTPARVGLSALPPHYRRSGARRPLLLLAVLLLAVFIERSPHSQANNNRTSQGKSQHLAHFAEQVSVAAAGRGNPIINLTDGHAVITSFNGPEDLQQALSLNQAEPLSMAMADFDEDGVPDLVSGYGYRGQGIVSVLRGNVDAIYSNAPEAQLRRQAGTFSKAPFLSPALVVASLCAQAERTGLLFPDCSRVSTPFRTQRAAFKRRVPAVMQERFRVAAT